MDQAETPFKPNILIAPLDWGLGHATRCIPIIRSLILKNCNVLIACEGKIRNLLGKEFPHLTFIELNGYRIHYSKNRWALSIGIVKQIPKIISTIQYENERLKVLVKEHNIHGVISDNRYGFYHRGIPSVFITHQLRIKTPFGMLTDNFLQRLNYRYINPFQECWVPDNEKESNLAGELSHPAKKPFIPIKYLGTLSRLRNSSEQNEKYLLILLSGPEPQRTVLENLLIEQLKEYKALVVLVRGLPGENHELKFASNILVYNHLPAEELAQKMAEAFMIISRCGYSTVMDLVALRKKSILIPTPGQTEQEYLAQHLMKNNIALCIEQKKFRIKNALDVSSHFGYQIEHFSLENNMEPVIDEFIAAVKTSMQ